MAFLFVIFMLAVSATVDGEDCASADLVWCEKTDFQIVLMHISQLDADTAEECKESCLNDTSSTCRAVDYSDKEKKCQLFNVTIFDEGVETTETAGVKHYWYICSDTCPSDYCHCMTQHPHLTVQDATDDSEDKGFLQWLREDPVWFALAGTGLLAILLFILIIVLICRLKRNGKDY